MIASFSIDYCVLRKFNFVNKVAYMELKTDFTQKQELVCGQMAMKTTFENSRLN